MLKSLIAIILAPSLVFAQVQIGGPVTAAGTTIAATGTPPLVFQITGPAGEPTGTVSVSYTSTACTTINGVAPVTYATNQSIPGLSFNTSTCVYSGTPTTAGITTFTITATDSASHTATTTLSINIQASAPPGGGHNEYCNSSNVWTGPSSKGTANAPTACLNTALANTPSPGSTVTVTAGSCSDLQSKITAAVAGEVIVIPALNGSAQDVFSNCRISPAATGNASNWITVETDQIANLPAEGTRVTPAWVGITSLFGRPSYGQPTTPGIYMPKIITNNNWAVQMQSGAQYWRFIGIEFTSAAGTNSSQLIQNAARVNDVIWDRVLVHCGNNSAGQDKDDCQNGIAMGSGNSEAVIDSYIYDLHCASSCTQSQGVGLGGNANANDGPFKVTNNFVESAGENIFSGGGGQGVGGTTFPGQDEEIRLNHVFKPLFWRTSDPNYLGVHFELDNLIELKNSQRAWIEGNIFENSTGGQGTQAGNAIIFSPRSQSNLCCTGGANSDGAGNITWVSGGHFTANLTNAACGVDPGHCLFVYNSKAYEVKTFVSSTQIVLQLCQLGCPNAGGVIPGTTLPPAGTALSFTAYNPGLNPNAVANDIIFLNNIVHGAARAGVITIAVSNGGDLPLSLQRVYVGNNGFDNIEGYYWNNKSLGACCVWALGWQIAGATPTLFPDSLTIDHNTIITYLSCSGVTGCNPGLGPNFMWNLPKSNQMTHLTVTNNIGSGGVNTNMTAEAAFVNATAGASALCADHNFFATTTNTLGPNGKGTFTTADNPPYPVAADSGNCSFTATGNTRFTDYTTILFTALNGGVGVNMQLQAGSPGHNAASDGTDVGVNWTTLQNAIAGVY